MLSKNKIKFIQSLLKKKNRNETGLFLAEGEKLIHELITANFRFHSLIYADKHKGTFDGVDCEQLECDSTTFKKISTLSTPQEVMAICHMPQPDQEIPLQNELIIALDNIQDPGNLGTIIRLASWFGVKTLLCSSDTVDCYNPKVIQATMGAIAHVKIHYGILEESLSKAAASGIEIYGTFLDGDTIYDASLPKNAIIVMGNEGNGISSTIEKLVSHKLFIPSFSAENRVESLNVSMATAIVCSEFRRTVKL